MNPAIDPAAMQAPPPLPHRALLARNNAYRAGKLEEFRHESEEFLRLLRLALNEAEGMAWSTPYPHLLLPALVEEKIHDIRRWATYQHRVSPGLHPVSAATNPMA